MADELKKDTNKGTDEADVREEAAADRPMNYLELREAIRESGAPTFSLTDDTEYVPRNYDWSKDPVWGRYFQNKPAPPDPNDKFRQGK